MKILVSWLKEFVDVPVEPRRLGEDLTLAGLAMDGLETLGQDAVLDLDVTTNRVDCMNVYGVAREVSVIYGTPLRPLPVATSEAGPAAGAALTVTIEAPDLCPRFCARVLDVRIGVSPSWIRDRLEACGVRPINNVVDLTNYAMLEMGQPCHGFDLGRIPRGALIVRWAREGERLRTLDGVERTCGPGTGVVAGTEGPLGLAGIMGGAASEVSEETRVVALEAASWEPLAVRRAARSLGMHTEASHRFERGADPEGAPLAVERIAHLLQKIGGGQARPGVIDVVARPLPTRTLTLRDARTRLVLGTGVPHGRAREILTGLGFRVAADEAERLSVEVPTWRSDVVGEADLVEEVGRHHGLDKIPSTLPPARGGVGLSRSQARERALRRLLVGAGLAEVINYSFVSPAQAAGTGGARLALANPLADVQGVLRDSLVVPGLLETLRTNLHQGRKDVRIFELGRVFLPGPVAPLEPRRLGILLSGAASADHWSAKSRPADFFDLKGIVEAVAARFGAGPLTFDGAGAPGYLHPGQSAQVADGRGPLGYLGALHPDMGRALELEAYVAELDLDRILQAGSVVRARSLDRFPSVGRDLSLFCDRLWPASEIQALVLRSGGGLLREVRFVDLYEGEKVPAGKVGVTVSLRYQHPERTLTGEEVQASMDDVIRDLRSAGAEIRGE